MRRLDELLTAATDRGDWMGPESLIQHLERRLAGEREQVVAAPRRSTMVATETRPTNPTEHPPRRRNRWAYALAAFALVAGSVAVAIALLGDGGEEEVIEEGITQGRAIELVQDFAANLRSGDMDALVAGSVPGILSNGFLEWHHGLEVNSEFNDCRIARESPNGFIVSCESAFDPDSFFARAASPTTSVSMDVYPSGLVNVASWPPPAGLGDAALELRAFFDARHPDLVDTVFGTGYAGMAWTEEAGATIRQHLDEFMTWRTSPTASVTPTEVMARLAAAIELVNSQIDEPIAADTDPMAESGFLAWNTALGLDPEFSGCEESAAFSSSSTFRCDVTMGEGYFFSVVADENLPTVVSATVGINGLLTAQSWPPPAGLVTMATEFRDWIRVEYPDLEDQMFGTDYGGVLKFSRQAGELHMQYLEEYLASR